jgi:RNA polymerase sigma-70 factor (ECF subfamily)
MDESDSSSGAVDAQVVATGTVIAVSAGRQEAALRALVERMAGREEAALGELYDQTSGLIYALALRMLRRREDAEEVTLDTFTKAWRNAASYDRIRGSVTAWLVIIARTIAIDRIRSTAGQAEKTSPLSDPSSHATSAAGPETNAWLSQQRARVQEALSRLPPEQRRAIELAFYSGLSHTELAEATGVPLGTVKTRVRLGMKRLRDLLEDLA